MANTDIKSYAKEKKVNLWEISESLGYSHETAFSRVLRHELAEDKKKEIYKIIDSLSSNKIEIQKTIICHFCGEEVLNKRFCSECGTMLTEMVE